MISKAQLDVLQRMLVDGMRMEMQPTGCFLVSGNGGSSHRVHMLTFHALRSERLIRMKKQRATSYTVYSLTPTGRKAAKEGNIK